MFTRPLRLSPSFLAGAKACLPVLPGLLAFGVIAGILAGAIAWRTRNTLLTIVAGMLALHLFSSLLT